MRGRATPRGHSINPIKVWQEADTKEELIKSIIDRELWNFYAATSLFCAILREQDKMEQHHADQVQHQFGGPIVTFDVEFDDGSPSEELEINVSWAAIQNSGIPTRY